MGNGFGGLIGGLLAIAIVASVFGGLLKGADTALKIKDRPAHSKIW